MSRLLSRGENMSRQQLSSSFLKVSHILILGINFGLISRMINASSPRVPALVVFPLELTQQAALTVRLYAAQTQMVAASVISTKRKHTCVGRYGAMSLPAERAATPWPISSMQLLKSYQVLLPDVKP